MKEGTGNVASLVNLIIGSFLDPDYVRSLNLWSNLQLLCGSRAPIVWEQGSHDLVLEFGAQRAGFKA
jgi:hypothetical protein